MRALILLIFVSTPAFAEDLMFSRVHGQGLTGLAQESDAQKIRDDLTAYAFMRRHPTSARAHATRQNCLENHDAHFFCDMILNEREKPAETGTDKDKRKKFYDAVLSLDDSSARAKKCPAARKTLTALAADETAWKVHARANYWLWVCAEALNDSAEATRIADEMIRRFPVAHHTLLILEKKRPERVQEMLSEGGDWPVLFRSTAIPEINAYIAGIEAAMELKEDGAAAVLGLYINAKLADSEIPVRLYMASLMSRVSASIPSVLPVSRVLTSLFQSSPELISAPLLKLLFPFDYKVAGRGVRQLIDEHRLDLDASLIAGLIHHESAFNPRAASGSKAYGLMQMLVGTATDQWRLLSNNKAAAVTIDMLMDPNFSVQVGAADFRRRLQTFGGHQVLAIASYNAGEAAVQTWLKSAGSIKDPQVLADTIFMNRMDAESHVPQYVGAVLAKTFWYARLYPSAPSQP